MHSHLVVESLDLSQLIHSNSANINRVREIKILVRGDDLTMVEDFVSQRFQSGPAILAVELDSEIFIFAARIVTGSEEDPTHAIVLSMFLVQLPDQTRGARSRNEAIEADIDVLDPVSSGHLDDDLRGDIIIVAAISGNHKGMTAVVLFLEREEYALHKVLKVVRLLEDLDFLTETTSTRLLVLVSSCLDCRHFKLL